MRNKIQINTLALFIAYNIFLSCNTHIKPLQNNRVIDSTSSGDTVVPVTHNLYVNDSLADFLNRISFGDMVEKIPIYLVRNKSKGSVQKFQYSTPSKTITLVETITEDNYAVYKQMYIGERPIRKFFQLYSDADYHFISFNSVLDDSIPAYLYVTPLGEFLLLEGTSGGMAATENYAHIMYEFLIPLNNTLSVGFIFKSLYVPNSFYLGYQKGKNRIICLEVESSFPSDNSEYVYDIYAKSIDVNTYKITSLTDTQGKEYYLKVAIPNVDENDKYRIVQSNWWK